MICLRCQRGGIGRHRGLGVFKEMSPTCQRCQVKNWMNCWEAKDFFSENARVDLRQPAAKRTECEGSTTT